MKTKFIIFLSSGLMALGTAIWAQSTNNLPLVQAVKYQKAVEDDLALGERLLLPPGVKEKLGLTEDQRASLKPIEDEFSSTCEQYQIANQPRIDAAMDAIKQARMAKDTNLIQDARRQLQGDW